MNKSFCDKNKKVYIKILDSTEKAEREEYGAKIFKQISLVPKIEKLDSKTISISSVTGELSTKIKSDYLNNLIVHLIIAKEKLPSNNIDYRFSVVTEINKLINYFGYNPEIVKFLNLLKSELTNYKFVPVHGDIQKQNMLFNRSGLYLIDFEHFAYAPSELELVNSVYYNDENCIDAETIIPKLISKGIFKTKALFLMLIYYAIRQVHLGTNANEVNKKLVSGISRSEKITKCKYNIAVPNLDNYSRNYWTASSCFA